MANTIVIDDGSKVYEVKNKTGEVLFEFVFKPSDTDIINRYEDVQKFFEDYAIPEELGTNEINEIKDTVINKIDYIVGADTKHTFFSVLSPLSPMPDGKLFFEVCLETIADVINKELDARIKKSQKRIAKYTQKYHG